MTRLIQFANNATSRLAANLSSVGLTASLIPGDGSKFPTLSAGQYFMATLIKADGTKEIVKVTARATDTLTIVRAAEPVAGVQTAYSFNAADKIELRLTAGELASEFDRLDKHALTGVLNKSANYTVVADDVSTLVRVNSTAGATTITLPLISSLTEDFIIAVAKVSDDNNSVYIAGSGGNTINGATPYALISQWQGAWLVADRSTNTWTAVSSGVGSSFVFVDKFTGTGAQTAFTLTAGVYSSNQVEVAISGVTQNPGIDYTASGTTLTFTTAPPNGLVILARYTQSSPQISSGTCTIEKQTATSGQTGFALANGYIPGSNTMQVFVNGLLLSAGTDYTETSANSVAFTSGLTLGDEVQFVVFGRSVDVGTADSENVSYLPAGTGAVATDVQGKLRESVSVLDFIPVGTVTETTDCTSYIQAAINTGKAVYVPTGAYLVDPRIGLVVRNGTTIFGDGRANSIFVAMPYGGSIAELVAYSEGSVIKRSFNPIAANNYVSYVHLYDFAVILNHPTASVTATEIQIGVDLRNITRSVVENVWVGNTNVTDQTVYTKVDPSAPYAAQGYGFVTGSVTSGDIAYAGGEVNIIRNCNAVGAYKGIVLDEGTLSPLSSSHSTTVERCDVQACHHLLTQESSYTAGAQFLDNTLQSIAKQQGDTSNSFVVRMEGYNGTVSGGYIEAGQNVDYILYLGASSFNNNITLAYYGSVTGAGNISDAGTNNTINYFENTATPPIVNSSGAPVYLYDSSFKKIYRERWAKFHWDGVSLLIDGSSGDLSITRTGVGDYTITYAQVFPSDDYSISVTLDTNSSGHGGMWSVFSHTSGNMRLVTYGQNGGTSTQIDPRFVWLRVGY